MLAATLLQACLAMSAPPGPPRDAAQPGFYYLYRRDPVPLTLDGSRLAVRVERSGDVSPAPLKLRGTRADLPIAGWSMFSLDEPSGPEIIKHLAGAEPGRFVSPVFLDSQGGTALVTQEILIRFGPHVTVEAGEAVLLAAAPVRAITRDFGGLRNLFRVRVDSPSGFDVLDAANRLALNPDVEFAEPNLIVTARLLNFIPNDEHFFRCWGLHATGQDIVEDLDLVPPLPPTFVTPDFDIDAPEAWDITTGDPAVIAVVFDQGVQLDHPDLQIDASLGRDFTTGAPGGVPGGGPVTACDNHGTTVAGVIGAKINNKIGGVGVAPNAGVASARIIVADCTNEFLEFGWAVEGLAWADSIGARITNHSYTFAPSAAFDAMIAATRDTMLHFGAAGNKGEAGITYPASLDDFFAVAATHPILADVWSSNYGPELDACAPGVGIFTTDRTGSDGYDLFIVEDDYVFMMGTSFSAPMAAGVAALMFSAKPSLTPDQADLILRRSCIDMGDPGWDPYHGHGHINAHRAVRWAKCPADLNFDGLTDFGDYLEFLNMYEAQDWSIDFNQDRLIDFNDYLEFLNLYDGSC